MRLMAGVTSCLPLGVVVWLPLLGLVLAFAVPCAHAVPLPTGDTALSGTTDAERPVLGGVVIEDQLIPYSFQGAGFSVSGVIQNRVVRTDDGTLEFSWCIMPDASSTGDITAFRVGGFHGFTLDGVGSVGPDTARNSGEGHVTFLFSDGVSATSESSLFFFLYTQATAYSNTGSEPIPITCVGEDEFPPVKEHMRGTPNSGSVPAEQTFCGHHYPGFTFTLGPGKSFNNWVIFPQVPEPGSEVTTSEEDMIQKYIGNNNGDTVYLSN